MNDTPRLLSMNRPQRVETYKANMYCGNCHKQFDAFVPKGTLAHTVNWTCTNCGCTKEQVEEAAQVQMGVAPQGNRPGCGLVKE